MNRIEEKAHPYADEIPQMEICDTEAVVPGQQKSDSITTPVSYTHLTLPTICSV